MNNHSGIYDGSSWRLRIKKYLKQEKYRVFKEIVSLWIIPKCKIIPVHYQIILVKLSFIYLIRHIRMMSHINILLIIWVVQAVAEGAASIKSH